MANQNVDGPGKDGSCDETKCGFPYKTRATGDI